MAYLIIIAALLVLSLIAYFILSRKLRTPTVFTEIITKKYVARLKKVETFLKKNKIEADLPYPIIESQELNWQAVENNLLAFKRLQKNVETIESVLACGTKDQVLQLISEFETVKIAEFKDELVEDKIVDIFKIMGYEESKLDFELQRYFGSQNFIKIENKMVFINNSLALVISPKNVFESEILNFKLIIKKINKNNYKITYFLGKKEYSTELEVPQPHIRKILNQQKNVE